MSSIELKDESPEPTERCIRLYVDGCQRAAVTKSGSGPVRYHWQVYGPVFHAEAKVILQGLLELSIAADQLETEVPRGKKK